MKKKLLFAVTVEVDAHDSHWLVAEGVLNWPGSWTPPRPPVEVTGHFGQNDAEYTVRVLRSEVLMEAPGEEDPSETLCTCGHEKAQHTYEEGACRPGFVCDAECERFTAP